MQRCANLLVAILGGILGVFYVLVGLVKVIPTMAPDIHQDMKTGFVGHAKISPLAAVGVHPDPETYMFSIGVAEVALGALLIIGPSVIKLLSNILLLIIMVGAVHAHVVQDDGPKVIPAAACFFLLGFRLLLATSFPSYAYVDDEDKKSR